MISAGERWAGIQAVLTGVVVPTAAADQPTYFPHHVDRAARVPTRDGTLLSPVHYRPRGGETRLPAIEKMSPYTKERFQAAASRATGMCSSSLTAAGRGGRRRSSWSQVDVYVFDQFPFVISPVGATLHQQRNRNWAETVADETAADNLVALVTVHLGPRLSTVSFPHGGERR